MNRMMNDSTDYRPQITADISLVLTLERRPRLFSVTLSSGSGNHKSTDCFSMIRLSALSSI